MIFNRGALRLITSTVGLFTLSSLNGGFAASTLALVSPNPDAAFRSPLEAMEVIALDNDFAVPERPLLKLESYGQSVTRLQQQLTELGHYTGEIDGHYGEKTQDAVIAFQTKLGLTPDGIVGVSTWKTLSASQPFAEVSPSTALLPLLSALAFERTPVAIILQPRIPIATPWLLFLMPMIPLTGGGMLFLQRRLTPTQRPQSYPTPPDGATKPSKLILWVEYFPLVGLFMAGLTAFIAYIYFREGLVEPIVERLEQATLIKQRELAHWFNHQRQGVIKAAEALQTIPATENLLSQQPLTDSEYQDAYDAISNHLLTLNAFGASNPDISILTNGGIVLFSTDKDRKGQYQPLQNTTTYFTRQQADTAIPNFYTSPITNELLITFATPLLNPAGKRVGVLAVNLDLAELDQKIRQPMNLTPDQTNYLGKTGETYLVGKSSRVKSEFVSAEKTRNDAFADGVSSRGIDNAMGGMNGFGLYLNYAKTPVVGVYRWAEKQNLALLSEISQKEVFRPVHQLTRFVFVSGLVIVSLLSMGLKSLKEQWLRSAYAETSSAHPVEAKQPSTESAHEQGN
ncbi:MAG: peptidoglycan-binding protein [Leptolyngbyaceae cyanobacterium MO_188.B28]|nr:peptidoglycan-binding protein [Leptolyngbyaceae cyanobacterium MO_188.B28]